jgi:hypothetical protein
MDQGTVTYVLTWVGTGAWVICFWWMHRISTRQDALLTERRESLNLSESLLLDSGVLADEQFNERTQQRFASLSHVVNELEKPEVEREFFL